MTSSTRVLPLERDEARADRRFLILALAAAVYVLLFVGATLAGAPDSLLSTVFTMSVPLVAPVCWLGFAKAPPELRLVTGCLSCAATLWLAGSLVWYRSFVEAEYAFPPPAGAWELLFAAAYALAMAGLWLALRGEISLRRAALDTAVVGGAGLAVGAALAGRELERDLTANSVATLGRPLLGVATIALVFSAALRRWQGLPLWIVLFASSQVCLTIGGIVYSYDAVGWEDVRLRWAELALVPGVALSLLAACALVMGVDRPVRLSRPERIPGHLRGETTVLAAALVGLAITLAVAVHGHLAGRSTVLVVGLASTAWIGIALALSARGAIRDLERSYERLDRAHVALEHAKDELAVANDELARANIELRSVHTAFEDLLVLTDERTHGGLRELVEDAGEDLARLLAHYLRRDY